MLPSYSVTDTTTTSLLLALLTGQSTTSECGQTLYGECLDTVNEFVADESTEPADDSVVTQSQSTGSNARLGTHCRELVVETPHEPRQQLRRHYTYTQ